MNTSGNHSPGDRTIATERGQNETDGIRILVVALIALWVGLGFAQDRTLIIAIPSDMQNLDPTLSGGDVLT